MDYVTTIAKVCHDANRSYCQSIGDAANPEWENAEQWQIDSSLEAVRFRLNNPDAPQSAQHDQWMKSRLESGWVYGETKDAAAKTHPCLVPYDQLPLVQQKKDALFQAIVDALK